MKIDVINIVNIQVPLGIYLYSEQKYEEMLQIWILCTDIYVPSKSSEEEVEINSRSYKLTREVLHQILLGGDQLTVARCRGCQIIRINSVTQTKKLCGLHPVIENWHAKVTLLEVCMYICHCIIQCMVVPVLINRFAILFLQCT